MGFSSRKIPKYVISRIILIKIKGEASYGDEGTRMVLKFAELTKKLQQTWDFSATLIRFTESNKYFCGFKILWSCIR